MVPFTFFEGVFFMSVGIVFFLGGALFYFFKKRIETLEKSNETLGNICKTMVSELESFKHIQYNEATPKYLQRSTHDYVDLSMLKSEPLNVIEEVTNESLNPSDNEDDEDDESNIESDSSSETTTIASEPNLNDNELESITNEKIDVIIDQNNLDKNEIEETTDETTNVVNNESNLEESEIIINDIQDITEEKIDIISENIDEINLEKNENVNFNEEIIAIEHLNLENDLEVESQVSKYTQSNLQKMNVQMLKTIIAQKNIKDDISNMKKKELINIILNN